MNQDLDYWVKLGKNQEPSGAVPLFEMRPFEVRKPDGEIEYEDRIFVRIMNRGDSKTVIERFLRPEDEREFERELKAFRSQLEPEVDGIPLKEFPALTPADIANCRKRHIRSVEELAEGGPVVDGKIMQCSELAERIELLAIDEDNDPSAVALMCRMILESNVDPESLDDLALCTTIRELVLQHQSACETYDAAMNQLSTMLESGGPTTEDDVELLFKWLQAFDTLMTLSAR